MLQPCVKSSARALPESCIAARWSPPAAPATRCSAASVAAPPGPTAWLSAPIAGSCSVCLMGLYPCPAVRRAWASCAEATC